MKKATVVIVDDHKLIREMWSKMFEDNSKVEITGESGTFHGAIEMIKSQTPDIVLLDINLPDGSGLDVVPIIKQFSPETKIIAVSVHNQLAYAKKMFRLGAKAYVTKNSSYEEILKAIDKVINGKTYVCAEIKEKLSDQILDNESDATNGKKLSVREMDVIRLIKQGLSSKEIAVKLGIATKTVEVHRYNILKRLNLKNTPALINYIDTTDLLF